MIRFIDPLDSLGSRLLEVEKPARYTGGEYGILAQPGAMAERGTLRAVMVFPDLYELGMSNQAFRIIYNGLNRMEGISCDRAFAPAPDFQTLLKTEGLPLYGLDTGIALADADLLLVTLGYELGITGLLSVLDASDIPLRSQDRGEESPIVIMGGPCVSNPLPYSRFVDVFWIGEAEGGFFNVAAGLRDMKRKGAPRRDLLEAIAGHPHIWRPGKSGVRRALQQDFGQREGEAAVFPVSSIKTVQHHGAVEIMRGCPNGCRFCHAGMWYRPMRQKQADRVADEVEAFVTRGGYREINLSSLSSGDYCGLNDLVEGLNKRWAGRRVSFQLPSLKVSGFSLPLLASVSEVRKSGLTFAVETPAAPDQLSINKQVSLDEVLSIIGEAKKRGWRGIKFYFMIGLPLGNTQNTGEEERIADFVLEAGKAAKAHFHINAGTFVPKAHTPYQRAAQLDEDAAWKKLHRIQDSLKPRGHKVSVHNPFISLLEGIISRGDEKTGELLESAYRRGCRLDAWSEYINTGIWRTLVEEKSSLVRESIRERSGDEELPWNVVESGVGEVYLEKERLNSERHIFTPPCGAGGSSGSVQGDVNDCGHVNDCRHPCGICGKNAAVLKNPLVSGKGASSETASGGAGCAEAREKTTEEKPGDETDGATLRMLFTFSKTGRAVFIPHLGVIEVFSAALVRSGIRAVYTAGFNPLLKLDFASPAPLGLFCRAEQASMDLEETVTPEDFTERINRTLPAGFSVTAAECFLIPRGAKKHSVSALLWGFRYGENQIPAAEEKTWRQKAAGGKNIYGLVRDGVLAKNILPPNAGNPGSFNGPAAYFELYKALYGVIEHGICELG